MYKKLFQHLKIIQRNQPYQESKEEKSSDRVNWQGKVFVKIQTPFRIKSLSKLGIEGTSLDYKVHIQKPTANIILNNDRASYLTVETECFAQGSTVRPCGPKRGSSNQSTHLPLAQPLGSVAAREKNLSFCSGGPRLWGPRSFVCLSGRMSGRRLA